MNKNQESIDKMLTLKGETLPTKPCIPNEEKMVLASKLIFEELLEAVESTDLQTIKKFRRTVNEAMNELFDKIKNGEAVFQNKSEDEKIISLRDAIGDIRVVHGNLVAFAGCSEIYQEDFEEIMQSNDTKFPQTKEPCLEAQVKYTEEGIATYIKEVEYKGEVYFALLRTKDDKFLKPSCYKKPVLKVVE